MGKLYKDYAACDWYECDKAKIERLREKKNVRVIVVHADWCPDCEYTIPNFKKVVQQLPNIAIEEVEVDFRKRDRAGIAERLHVRRIPTFVVFYGDREVGRIVEYPSDTIEGDLCRFLGIY